MVGQARGVAVLACKKGGLEIEEYTPLQIKQALVGYGRADKKTGAVDGENYAESQRSAET